MSITWIDELQSESENQHTSMGTTHNNVVMEYCTHKEADLSMIAITLMQDPGDDYIDNWEPYNGVENCYTEGMFGVLLEIEGIEGMLATLMEEAEKFIEEHPDLGYWHMDPDDLVEYIKEKYDD